jgi:hypothetical protein
MKKQIKWTVKEVLVSQVKPAPTNYKLKFDEGMKRFATSVESYGLAGAIILNTDYTLIDGHTRLEKAKEMGLKKIAASMPDRKLTPKEFTEFLAMYDMARAGEVDMLRIKEELGTTESFFKKWGLELPETALSKLAELEKNEKVINPTSLRATPETVETARITLLFTPEEAEEYLRLSEKLYKHFKVDNVTDLALKVVKHLSKSIKG